jgi:hypothetical protein
LLANFPEAAMSTVVAPAPLKLARWRTPIVLIAIGCVIALIAFGPRSTLGQFLSPLSFDRGSIPVYATLASGKQ